MKRSLRSLLVLVLLGLLMALYFNLRTPGHLYRHSGVFHDCPARPSCVSSVATDAAHAIAPLRYQGSRDAAQALLEAQIDTQPRAEIAHREPGYLHVIYSDRPLRQRDDLELRLLPDGLIQVRSLSRFGYRDGGANRSRVETLRNALPTLPTTNEPETPAAEVTTERPEPPPEDESEDEILDEDEVYDEEEIDEADTPS